MRNSARLLSLATVVGAALFARPAGAATQTAVINASVVKPLELTRVQDLNLGTITLLPGTWSSATVGISQSGVFTCPGARVVCTGTVQVAKYNVVGSNKGVVKITAPNVTLINQGNAAKTLTLVVDSPGTVTLTNSGQPGSNFPLGGTITISSTTAEGTYVGNFNVTVEYQ